MKKPHGFTLVEVLTVIVIISIIAGIAVVGYHTQQKITRDDNARSGALVLSASLDDYYDKNGNYPVTCDIGSSSLVSCAELSNTYSGMTTPPTITAATTVANLKSILPKLDSDFSHPNLETSTVINQQDAGIVSAKSYFLLSMDMVPGAVATTPESGTILFQDPNGGSFSCGFELTGLNAANDEDVRPHQYIIGAVSENNSEWQFYISPQRLDQNILRWNTASETLCSEKSIGELKIPSSS